MRWWIILTVVSIVYNVIVFAIPIQKNMVFFLSWTFTLIAIGVQAYVIYKAFGHGENVKSKFYGFPIAKIGVMYLAIQMVLGLVFMVLGAVVPAFVPLVLYVILLGASVIGFVAADAARDQVIHQDVKLERSVSLMRTMQAQMHMIAARSVDMKVTATLQKLDDEFRFSDPVSNKMLEKSEARLSELLSQLQQAEKAHETETVLMLCQEVSDALTERNAQCKLSKQW